MKTMKIIIGLVLFSVANGFSQDGNLKNIYTKVTTAINSVLLTRSGSMEVSGLVSYNYFNTQYKNNTKMTQQMIQAEPQFSYFVIDDLALGIGASYQNQKTEYDPNTGSVTTEQTFIGPLAKMYFGEKEFRPFVQADYLVLTGDYYKGGELDLGAGLFYHATGNFGLSLFAKYGIIWSSKDNIDSQNRIFVGIGLSGFIL